MELPEGPCGGGPAIAANTARCRNRVIRSHSRSITSLRKIMMVKQSQATFVCVVSRGQLPQGAEHRAGGIIEGAGKSYGCYLIPVVTNGCGISDGMGHCWSGSRRRAVLPSACSKINLDHRVGFRQALIEEGGFPPVLNFGKLTRSETCSHGIETGPQPGGVDSLRWM